MSKELKAIELGTGRGAPQGLVKEVGEYLPASLLQKITRKC